MDNKFNIAVLIDGDNAQPKLIQAIIEEVSKYGKATIRRIYGDWTTPQMNGWKEVINQQSFNPVQKFAYTSGKNSTDSSLIIDAMDILHSKNVEGFCIVSSDSDYTGLAKRIREGGVFVMGIGQKKTPVAFVQSCEIFTYTENIATEIEEEEHEEEVKTATAKAKSRLKPKPAISTAIIDKAFDISINEDEEAYIATIGSNLRKIDPSFDPRAFGYKTLTQLFQNLPKYEILKNVVNGLNHPLVKKKKGRR
ncbi:NYN domain-containing protein [Flavobacterium alkalisoli]|uniref:NYN domain-containing protein n=1 Tax=Flavobacterium alkalisoli TaxID=2602769 RepID=A0A5B9FYT4_9FLAO|nr:NYN domain-containing protein [Flavobacterium alkalisoli]QEE50062.1 NYN domain-containing protein [Flavobacterium alkalisoli]